MLYNISKHAEGKTLLFDAEKFIGIHNFFFHKSFNFGLFAFVSLLQKLSMFSDDTQEQRKPGKRRVKRRCQ